MLKTVKPLLVSGFLLVAGCNEEQSAAASNVKVELQEEQKDIDFLFEVVREHWASKGGVDISDADRMVGALKKQFPKMVIVSGQDKAGFVCAGDVVSDDLPRSTLYVTGDSVQDYIKDNTGKLANLLSQALQHNLRSSRFSLVINPKDVGYGIKALEFPRQLQEKNSPELY